MSSGLLARATNLTTGVRVRATTSLCLVAAATSKLHEDGNFQGPRSGTLKSPTLTSSGASLPGSTLPGAVLPGIAIAARVPPSRRASPFLSNSSPKSLRPLMRMAASRTSSSSATSATRHPPPPKDCAVCGRQITWRKKWERNWDEVKYCSDKCRHSRGTLKSGYEERILEILATRDAGKTMCPSEVLPEGERQDRGRMEEVRQAARRLVHAGVIEITQKGQVVEPSAFRGPIRLRLVRK